MKKIFIFCFVIFLGLLLGAKSDVLAAPEAANLKRFGVNWGYMNTNFDVFNPVVTDIGVGWYNDWAPHNVSPRRAGLLAQKGIQRLTLVLAREPYKYYSAEACSQLKTYVGDNPEAFIPEMTFWAVGNELGLDPDDLTPKDYAKEFISWRDCIKSINPNYKVGSGAITSMWDVLPRTYPMSCTDINSANSGKAYLKSYINRIKTSDPNKLPDFMTMHAYSGCTPPMEGDMSSFSKFKNSIVSYRQAMKELGLQNKELWIKEFNGRGYGSDFLTKSFEYLINTKDSNLGYPGDSNRLVQRFGWYMLKNTVGGKNLTPQVLAGSNGTLTQLGEDYREISRKYAGTPVPNQNVTPRVSPTGSQPTSKPGDANGDGVVNEADVAIWKLYYGKNVSPMDSAFANFNSDKVVNGLDYAIIFQNYEN